MYNFNFNLSTKIYFGENQITNLGKEIKNYSNKVLIVYGGGSIKKNGIFEKAIKELDDNGIDYVEMGGVDPNPRIESVYKGIKLCKENNLDGILAIGGGSSIDCAKVISAGVLYDGDAWDLLLDRKLVKNSIPVFTVLTLAATGSEMNMGAVISNLKTNQKLGTGGECTKPKVSILDPTYTFSVPKKHTAAGVADIISHTFENYFTPEKDTFLQLRMAEAILKTCFHYGPIAYNNPENYEARANLMWASSWAINGLLSAGSATNWSVHPIEHELSAFYDVTHGEGLAIITPNWMKYVLNDENVDRFVEYGVNVWNIDNSLDKYEIANIAIDKTKEFFTKELHIPSSLSELGIDDSNFDIMAEQAVKGKTINGFVKLSKDDVKEIYKMCLK